jgi:hypothetical protein
MRYSMKGVHCTLVLLLLAREQWATLRANIDESFEYGLTAEEAGLARAN